MNNERRKSLTKAIELLEQAKSLIDDAASEERDYYDNMPESLQSGDKGSTAEQAASDLEEAASTLEDVISNIDQAKG